MLKTHQKLGLITTAPLIATVITGLGAGGKHTSNTDRNVHAVLGSATAGLYFTSASFAIFAPKIKGTPTRGPIRLHKALAWIHGPGMVLTPILGAMALYLACISLDPSFPCLVGIGSGFGGRPVDDLRRVRSVACAVERPPALLSHAVENPRPLEPAFTRSAREVIQGRGAETQSNPESVRITYGKKLPS